MNDIYIPNLKENKYYLWTDIREYFILKYKYSDDELNEIYKDIPESYYKDENDNYRITDALLLDEGATIEALLSVTTETTEKFLRDII